MTRKEIKRTVEELVRVEYVAEDGQVFYTEEECKKYEKSALFAVSNKLKKLNADNYTSVTDLFGEGYEEDEVEIFDIQTDEDLENLRRYLYLKLKENGATDRGIEDCFVSVDGTRNNFVFNGVTKGHEVIICWSCDKDHFWVYRNGSIEGCLSYLRDKMLKLITPKTTE